MPKFSLCETQVIRKFLILLTAFTTCMFGASPLPDELVQKTQNLAIGACAAYDAEFCSRHVENSVCNKVKNECFCRKDFVAIRESGRVTCKTLLTDLKCRVDRDCVHVNRSSCHPGAGYCSCPGNTIYVPQLHACRNRLDYSRDVVCKACQQKRGICFLHEKYDQPEEDVRYNQNRIGCVCPGSGQATRIKSDDWSSGICAGQLVDIGLQCDGSVTFCRSRNAVCRRIRENTAHATSIHSTQLWQKPSDDTSERSSENNEVAVCQCKENTVPVYQTTLSYTECFPTLPFNASKCESCSRVNGECYDLNSDGIGDGCVCPPHLSTFRNRLDSNVEFCTQSHVATNCSDGFFSVCYAPHSGEPYEELTSNLLSGMAVVRLAPSTGGDNADVFGTSTDNTRSHISGFNPETVVSRGTAYRHFYTTAHVDSTKPQRHVASSLSHSCQLIEYKALQKTRTDLPYGRLRQSGGFGETSVDSDLFCVHLNVWQYQTQCGVRLYRLGRNVIQYEALLEILVNRSVRTPSQDLQIPIKCIAPEPKRSPDMNTKSSTGANEDFRATRTTAQITQSMTVELRLLSSANKEIDVTTEGTPIRLDILLVDNTGQYKFITVEQCYYSNRSILSGNKEQHILFIQNGCPVKSSKLIPVQFTNHHFPSAHIQSDLFAAFRLGKLNSVFFQCRLVLCTEQTDCKQVPCDTSSSPFGTSLLNWQQPRSTKILPVVNEDIFNETQTNIVPSSKKLFITRWAHVEVHENDRDYKDTLNKNSVGLSGLTDTQFQPMGPTAMSSSVSSSINSSCPYAVCLNMHQLIWISVGLILLLFLVGLLMLVVYKRTRFLGPNKHCGSPLHLSTSTSNMYYPAKSVNPQIPRQKRVNSFSRPYQLSAAALYQVTPAVCNEPVCYPKVEAPDYSFADENICSHHLYKHSDIESFYGSGLRKESCAGYLNLTVGRAGTNAADLYCHSSPAQADRRQPNVESCSASPLIAAGQVHEPIELQCGEIKHAPINTQSLGHRQDVRFCDGNFLKLSPRQFSSNSDHADQDELAKRPTKQASRTLEKMSPLSSFAPQCDLILLNNCTASHFPEGHPPSINLPVSNSVEDKH